LIHSTKRRRSSILATNGPIREVVRMETNALTNTEIETNEISTAFAGKRNLQITSDHPLQVVIHVETPQITVSGRLGGTGTVDYLPKKRSPTRDKEGQLVCTHGRMAHGVRLLWRTFLMHVLMKSPRNYNQL
jgi:hypothetical protein